jgi:hypothetical protein
LGKRCESHNPAIADTQRQQTLHRAIATLLPLQSLDSLGSFALKKTPHFFLEHKIRITDT